MNPTLIACGVLGLSPLASASATTPISVAPSPGGSMPAHTLLILDHESVESANDVTFELNHATKHPENPILLPGAPHQWDSLQVTWPGTVLYDASAHLFRCWYSGMDAVQEHRPLFWAPGYAESKDGIHWEKPILGQHVHLGEPTNRFGIEWSPNLGNATSVLLSTVWFNPDQSDPERRFLSLWGSKNPQKDLRRGKGLASSPDGKRWKWERVVYEPEPNGPQSLQDVCQVFYRADATDREYTVIGYSQLMRPRSWDQKVVRNVGFVHGADFNSLKADADPVLLAPLEGTDEEIHFLSVSRVGEKYLMLFESDRFATTPLHGDLRLAISDDGLKFRRVHPQSALVATGAKGMWDENMLVTTSWAMQTVGDEVWIFYFGVPNVYVQWPAQYNVKGLRGAMYYPSYLGVALLPRDRYACAVGSGKITTHPLVIGPGGLWLNVEGNEATVAALDHSGEVIAQGILGEKRRQTVYREVTWQGHAPTDAVRLKISLGKGVRLYSLQH